MLPSPYQEILVFTEEIAFKHSLFTNITAYCNLRNFAEISFSFFFFISQLLLQKCYGRAGFHSLLID